MAYFLKSLGLLLVIWLALPQHTAMAQRRVALVIGNGAYQSVAKLPNPPADAAAMASALGAAGFEIVANVANADHAAMLKALRAFEDRAVGADIGLVYYAGHGMEANGQNYLVPVDAALASDRDLEDEAVSLDRVLRTMDGVVRLRLVILDACRDNPFAPKMARANGTRSISRGLGRVEPAAADTLVAFAARAGTTASDGAGANSPFTAALVRNLLIPGLDVRLALGQVRDDVLAATNREQEPFVYGSLGGGILALSAAGPVAPPVSAAGDAAGDFALADKIGTEAAWNAFLARHPDGYYADLARAALASKPAVVAAVPVSPSRPAIPATLPASLPVVRPPPSAPQQTCRQRVDAGQGSDTYCASSVLPAQSGNNYGVGNLLGLAPDQTAWVANTRSYAIDEWLLVEMKEPREIRQILIDNGYQKSSDIYFKNSRVKDVDVNSSLGTTQHFRLDDAMGTQKLTLDKPLKASWIQIVIKSVYPGSKYTDTAISKLGLN